MRFIILFFAAFCVCVDEHVVEMNQPADLEESEAGNGATIPMGDSLVEQRDSQVDWTSVFRQAVPFAPSAESETLCSICFDSIDEHRLGQLFECSHSDFHIECVKQWISKCDTGGVGRTCPLCRKDAVEAVVSQQLGLRTRAEADRLRRLKMKGRLAAKFAVMATFILGCATVVFYVTLAILKRLGYPTG